MRNSPLSFCTTRGCLLVLSLLVGSSRLLAAQGLTPLPDPATRIDSFLRATTQRLAIPGLAVAVVKDGTVVLERSYGVATVEWQQPVTAHTTFQIASSSKLLASTLVMKALYTKKLRLDAPVSTFIDSLPAAWQPMQLRHLLNHTSGIPRLKADPYLPLPKLVRLVRATPLTYAVGQDQSYDSYDYTILRYILEKVYGKPYEQVLREEVTGPLGMHDGGYDMERRNGQLMETVPIAQKSTTYYGTGANQKAYKFIYPPYTYLAGGYFASIEDMAHWAVGLDKGTLFPRAFLTSLIQQQGLVNGKPSEFSQVGWIVQTSKQGLRAVGHSGGPGLGDVQRYPQDGYTVLVLSNDGELLPNLAAAVASFYLPGRVERPVIKKFTRTSSL